jgi:DNA-binding CsgD family transcriptional regulator
MRSDTDAGGPLALSDYERILDVLGECAGARSLAALRETLLESLASRFGYRHAAVFIGPTRGRLFQDPGALTLGRPGRMLPAYLEHYHRWDPLAQLAARRGAGTAGCTLVLDQTRPYLTDENRMYLDRHLYTGGFHAMLCMEGAGDAVHIGLGLFGEREGAFSVRDIAIVRRLGRLATRQAELLTRLPQAPGWAASLTPRQVQVARLVGRGCTNQEIAAALCITLDTVKKHVKAASVKAGTANRAGLAARTAGLDT